jgi:Uma2 family endonuclease
LYIPDIAVFLTESRIKTADGSLENPHTVIEVLSPGTEKKDRNEKLKNYQQIDSVQECLLIAQDCYKIEQYLREGKTKWTVKVYDSQHDTLILTVGVKVQLSELYKETDWA